MDFLTTTFATISAWFIAFVVPVLLKILAVIITLAITWLIGKFGVKYLGKIMAKSSIDPAATGFICSVTRVVIYVLGIITALGNLVQMTSLIAALGAAGLTASFALQGSLSNFVSGMQVIFSKPFKIGDFLSVGTHTGTVKSITVLNTTLVTIDNKEIIIPNSTMTSDAIINFNAQTSRRIDLSYSVSYKTDTAFAKKVIASVIAHNPQIFIDPAPIIVVGEHGASSVEIIAKVWVNASDYWDVYYFMQEQVKNAFDANKIEIPFPQIDVHTK